jgi:hypothetical protein
MPRKKNHMKKSIENECEDLTVTIPCELADRIRKYGEHSGTDLNTLMIVALDDFLRNSKQ